MSYLQRNFLEVKFTRKNVNNKDLRCLNLKILYFIGIKIFIIFILNAN